MLWKILTNSCATKSNLSYFSTNGITSNSKIIIAGAWSFILDSNHSPLLILINIIICKPLIQWTTTTSKYYVARLFTFNIDIICSIYWNHFIVIYVWGTSSNAVGTIFVTACTSGSIYAWIKISTTIKALIWYYGINMTAKNLFSDRALNRWWWPNYMFCCYFKVFDRQFGTPGNTTCIAGIITFTSCWIYWLNGPAVNFINILCTNFS